MEEVEVAVASSSESTAPLHLPAGYIGTATIESTPLYPTQGFDFDFGGMISSDRSIDEVLTLKM